MSAKKSYNRFFIIFQEEDKGFGIAIDKQPTGYTKIETRNGKCKITVYVQNLSRDKGPYVCRLMDASKDNVLIASLGEIKLDETGRGETWWEYKEEDIANTGNAIDKFGVAAVVVDDEKLQAPLAGYAGKEKQLWKEKLLEASRHKDKDKECHKEEKETHDDDHEKELEEEAKKFKEYEELLKKDMEELQKKEEEKEKEECMKQHQKDYEHHEKDHDHDEHHDHDEYHDHHDHDEHHDEDHECHEKDHDEHKKEYLDIKDMENNCQWTSNMDTYIKDNKEKYHENADAFHKILKDYEEDKDLAGEFKDARWWKIPYNEYETYKGKASYEHYCAVHHLKMAYPYMNYINYFKKYGYSYFGIKYDKDGEVKYLMYGIAGDKTSQDQPYMGMTGFVKWIKPNKKNKGMWIMYYNPYNGCIMIPKAKEN